jgi:hypothetical protein
MTYLERSGLRSTGVHYTLEYSLRPITIHREDLLRADDAGAGEWRRELEAGWKRALERAETNDPLAEPWWRKVPDPRAQSRRPRGAKP